MQTILKHLSASFNPNNLTYKRGGVTPTCP